MVSIEDCIIINDNTGSKLAFKTGDIVRLTVRDYREEGFKKIYQGRLVRIERLTGTIVLDVSGNCSSTQLVFGSPDVLDVSLVTENGAGEAAMFDRLTRDTITTLIPKALGDILEALKGKTPTPTPTPPPTPNPPPSGSEGETGKEKEKEGKKEDKEQEPSPPNSPIPNPPPSTPEGEKEKENKEGKKDEKEQPSSPPNPPKQENEDHKSDPPAQENPDHKNQEGQDHSAKEPNTEDHSSP